MMISTQASSLFFFLASSLVSNIVNGHGYLKTPRSRNIVAAEDGLSWGGDENDPKVENCPQCLNRGGTLAACGKVGETNYDFPPSAIAGKIMGKNIQATVAKGGTLDVEVVLTAHHKGHFDFYVCPVTDDTDAPTDDCFKKHPLTLVEDLLYNAPQDPNHPGRAYIPPLTYPGIVMDSEGSVPGSLYHYRMQLPDNVQGDRVLLQWHYISANSCLPDTSYTGYNFPIEWGDVRYSQLPICKEIPADGDGAPEQFWNCAELAIEGDTIAAEPTGIPSQSPSQAPTIMESADATDTVAPTSLLTTVPPTAAPSFKTPTPATLSPTSSPTASVTAFPTVLGGEPIVSSENRCGVSELDARANCGSTCSSVLDCATGEWCWSVHSNFCGTRPNFAKCDDLSKANGNARCGKSEMEARELCGAPCSANSDCGTGESCFATHQNTCDCVEGNNNSTRGRGRALRGAQHL